MLVIAFPDNVGTINAKCKKRAIAFIILWKKVAQFSASAESDRLVPTFCEEKSDKVLSSGESDRYGSKTCQNVVAEIH